MEPGLGSPLDAAVNQRDRAAVAMARAALDRDDVALAFQPVIRAAPPHGTAFHEGLLRLMDETGRIIPAADFMAAVETHELGRLLDCAALSLGLRTLAAQPDCGCRSTCRPARSGIPASRRSCARPCAGRLTSPSG